MILVTGGAGFIGSNFVLDWLAGSDEPVVNLDKLTCVRRRSRSAPLITQLRQMGGRGIVGRQQTSVVGSTWFCPRICRHQ